MNLCCSQLNPAFHWHRWIKIYNPYFSSLQIKANQSILMVCLSSQVSQGRGQYALSCPWVPEFLVSITMGSSLLIPCSFCSRLVSPYITITDSLMTFISETSVVQKYWGTLTGFIITFDWCSHQEMWENLSFRSLCVRLYFKKCPQEHLWSQMNF
jgi:hypothetical protein